VIWRVKSSVKTKYILKQLLTLINLYIFLNKGLEKEEAEDSYAIGKSYFGNYGSGNGDLSTEYKRLFGPKLINYDFKYLSPSELKH
jgi:hypothetical protein